MKSIAEKLVSSSRFELFITLVIITNCVLIGVETYFTNPLIQGIQLTALAIFTVEVVIRFTASRTARDYFKDGWNVFDLSIVLVSFIPESLFEDTAMVTAIRVLRIFRVLRLLRSNPEIKLIVAVLIRSFSALTYNAIFFFIFMYLFAIIGVTLFKLPDVTQAAPEVIEKLEHLKTVAPHTPVNSPEPYGTLGEAMFTLFRVLTGEDWTDIRYNLLEASQLNLIHSSETVITVFHVSWYIISAFLMLNLLVGAILNNYQIIMEEVKNEKSDPPLE